MQPVTRLWDKTRTAGSHPFSVSELKTVKFKTCISSENHDGNLQQDTEI